MNFKSILSGSYTGFENRISRTDFVCPVLAEHKVAHHFMFLPFIESKPSENEFVNAIYERIVPFCLPHHVVEKQLKLFEEDKKNTYLITQLQEKAKNLFQKAKGSRKTAGELGELILFVLQEHLLEAPQIACKMNLKTNKEMPIHGADGIHVLKKENGEIFFLWGESKVYKDAKQAVKKLVGSIVDFNKADEFGIRPKDRDIEILNDHPNISDKAIENQLLKYFNPYEKEYNHRNEAYACFVGFDFGEFKELETKSKDNVEEIFREIYHKKISEITKAFSAEIKKSNIYDQEFYFFLIPFTSVKELRRSFFAKLGVTDVYIEDED